MSAEKDKNQTIPEEQELNIPAAEESGADVVNDLETPVSSDGTDKVAAELAEMKDKYLRLFAEFDNYKRRTSKERMELLKTANQEMMAALLPVMDDLERAKQATEKATDVNAVKEGLDLVFNKLANVLQQKGLKAMDATGQAFDADLHEAITQIPAGDEMKGKVVDEVEKGYYLNDKVIRFAKVVIGA